MTCIHGISLHEDWCSQCKGAPGSPCGPSLQDINEMEANGATVTRDNGYNESIWEGSNGGSY